MFGMKCINRDCQTKRYLMKFESMGYAKESITADCVLTKVN